MKVYCFDCKYFKDPLWWTNGAGSSEYFKCRAAVKSSIYGQNYKHPSEVNNNNNCNLFKPKYFKRKYYEST